MRPLVKLLAGATFAVLSAASAHAFSVQPQTAPTELVTPVAQGCPAGYWPGPWGHCRDTPYYGRLPGGGFATHDTGCPVGYWRGPWGNCRNTPYHGRLPGGGWQ